MIKRFIILLAVFLVLGTTCSIAAEQSANIKLPEGATIETAQHIINNIFVANINGKVLKAFPDVDQSKYRIYLKSAAMTTIEGLNDKNIYITAGIKYKGQLPAAAKILKFEKTIVQKAIENHFTPPDYTAEQEDTGFNLKPDFLENLTKEE